MDGRGPGQPPNRFKMSYAHALQAIEEGLLARVPGGPLIQYPWPYGQTLRQTSWDSIRPLQGLYDTS